MQRDIGARPGIGSRGEIVGIGFSRNLEYHHLDGFGYLIAIREPLASGPALHNGLRVGRACFSEFCYIVKCVKHQQRLL